MYTTPYEGASAEAGYPSEKIHPFAPKNSRAFGDSFVHYVTHMETDTDIIRLWFSEVTSSKVLTVDFILLDSNYLIQSTDGDEMPLNNQNAVNLIKKVFFKEFCMDYYKDKISGFVFRNLNDGFEIETVYV